MNASVPPRVAAVIKLDTMGDLVLFGPALQALRTHWTGTRIVAVCRREYAELAASLVPGVEWITTTINPFAQGPSDQQEEAARLRARVVELHADIFLAATSRRNWLELLLASASEAPRRISGGGHADEFFSTQLRLAYGVDETTAFNETAASGEEEPDWRANFRIVDAALGTALPRTRPAFALDPDKQPAIGSFLRSNGLRPGGFAVCAAAGFANVALKTWPADKFAGVIRHLRETYGLATVLVGHGSEAAHLDSVRRAAGVGTFVWHGHDGALLDLAALILQSKLFVGNDTGAMHLAGALDVPVVAVYGGGTWPRFAPAGRRSVAVVQPLPCFGCGWDCAFGDAPCIREISERPVIEAVALALAQGDREFSETLSVTLLSAETKVMMGKAAALYRSSRQDHLARQHKLEELTALDREKDREINALKRVCDEREQTLIRVDRHARALQDRVTTLEADQAVLQQTLRALPEDKAKAAKGLADQAIHIRNVEALLKLREQELVEVRAASANRQAGLHDLENAKHYGRLLTEKEHVIRSLQQACADREAVIRQLSADSMGVTSALRKLWLGFAAWWHAKVSGPLDEDLFDWAVEKYWMQIGMLRHYAPRPLKWDDRIAGPRMPDAALPRVAVVTPSYNQNPYLPATLSSVLDQHYPKLLYVVQDGGSTDGSVQTVQSIAARLHHWESARDGGQADAILKGFSHVAADLQPDDVMAWLNSDDLFGPGVLRHVAEYFTRHPEVDVVYGHRIIIDEQGGEIGRWIMPRHDPETLEWIDYVPQETLFWRKRAWDRVGGLDPTFHFALDWDLLARFQQAGCRMVRLPYFLGAFRVHTEQKTSQAIHTVGADEMRRIRARFHGERCDDGIAIERHARRARFRGAVTARLLEVGIRW